LVQTGWCELKSRGYRDTLSSAALPRHCHYKAQVPASEAMRKDAQVPSVVPSMAPSVAPSVGPSVAPSVGVRPRVHARGIWSKEGFFGGDRRFLNKESPLCCYLGLPRSAGLMARVAWISLLSARTKSTGLSHVWCCPGLWCKWGLFHCTWRVIWQLLWIGPTEKGKNPWILFCFGVLFSPVGLMGFGCVLGCGVHKEKSGLKGAAWVDCITLPTSVSLVGGVEEQGGGFLLWLDWATIQFRFFGPSSFNTALQLVLRPHSLVHFV
jgi:hypothetical protein